MPDPITIAVIGAIGGIIGGALVAMINPVGQNFVNSKQHDREVKTRREDEAAQRARDEENAAKHRAAERRDARIALLDQLQASLTTSTGSGLASATEQTAYRATPAIAADIDDPALSSHIGTLMSSGYGTTQWLSAKTDALTRTGQLRKELREEG